MIQFLPRGNQVRLLSDDSRNQLCTYHVAFCGRYAFYRLPFERRKRKTTQYTSLGRPDEGIFIALIFSIPFIFSLVHFPMSLSFLRVHANKKGNLTATLMNGLGDKLTFEYSSHFGKFCMWHVPFGK